MRRTLFEDEHEDFRASWRHIPRARGRASLRPVGTGAPRAPRGVREGGRLRVPRHGRAGGARRRGRGRLPLQRRAERGGAARGPGIRPPRHVRAQRHLPAVLPELRHRGAEAALAARARERRADRGDRDDGARHRVRPGGNRDVRGPQGRRVRGQRREDLHHERDQRRPRRHGRAHRPRRAPPRPQPRWWWSAARPASSAGATSRRSGRTRRTPRSCSSTTRACRRRTCSANEGEGFAYLVSNLPQERLSIAVAAVAAAEAALGWTVEYVRDRKAFGDADRLVPEHALRAGRDAHRGRRRAGVRRPLRGGAERRRADRRGRRRARSGGAPSCRAASSTAACSCTAATATCSSTRSRAPTPTRA